MNDTELKELLDYNPETGVFIWKVANRRTKSGSVAGTLCNGYVKIGIGGKHYSAHRLAWLYVYGIFPKKQIDHINQDRSDNRILNLREVSTIDNGRNRVMQKNNTSGITGVQWRKSRGKWVSVIKIAGELRYLGCFSVKEDAIKARKEAEAKYGFHPNHGSRSKTANKK
jgi:hypothetical protein